MAGALLAVASLTGGTSGSYPDGTVLFSQSVAGAWMFIIPAGVAFVWVIGTGPGGVGSVTGTGKTLVAGPGGGAGGYFQTHSAVSVGNMLSGLVGVAGMQGGGGPVASSPTTLNAVAALSLLACNANGGGFGVYGVGPGAGGTAAGGTVANTTGHAGGRTNTWDGGGAPPGLADNTSAGTPATAPGGGSPGGFPLYPGAAGLVQVIAKSA